MLRMKVLMWRILFILMFLAPICLWITEVAEGAEFGVLRKAAIEGGSYQGANHDYFLELDRQGERLQHTTRMLMDIDLACTSGVEVCAYWNNAINSKASSSQYRMVQWSFLLGLSLGNAIELGWSHSSIHELDRKSSEFARFPLENVIYIQFKWYEKPRR